MAQKRMFDKSITNSDNFLELPDSSQILYFHLSMNADDDGFVDNWKSIMRMTGTKEDDLRILVAKSYVIPFEAGVIVIKHWRMNNYLRTDRYKETTHKLEKSQLILGENEEYLLANNSIGIPMVDTDKNSIDKNSIDKNSIDILSGKPDKLSTEIKAIVDYLNEVSGKNFRAGTPKTKALIKARLNEGFSVNDFKAVIDKKYKQWRGGDMEKYIRPETLFGTKFEGYLNESDVVKMPRTKKHEETPSERAMRMLNEVIGGQTE